MKAASVAGKGKIQIEELPKPIWRRYYAEDDRKVKKSKDDVSLLLIEMV